METMMAPSRCGNSAGSAANTRRRKCTYTTFIHSERHKRKCHRRRRCNGAKPLHGGALHGGCMTYMHGMPCLSLCSLYGALCSRMRMNLASVRHRASSAAAAAALHAACLILQRDGDRDGARSAACRSPTPRSSTERRCHGSFVDAASCPPSGFAAHYSGYQHILYMPIPSSSPPSAPPCFVCFSGSG